MPIVNILRRVPKPLLPFVALDTALKGVAAWKAVRNRQFIWALALIVFNTAGVLPLLYLIRFQSKGQRIT